MSTMKALIADAVDSLADDLEQLSHRIHANPELAYQEIKAAGWLAELLTAQGFAVERGVGGVLRSCAIFAASTPLRRRMVASRATIPSRNCVCCFSTCTASDARSASRAARRRISARLAAPTRWESMWTSAKAALISSGVDTPCVRTAQ